MKYNPKSMRAAYIAKYLPELSKAYRTYGNLELVVEAVRNFGINNLDIEDLGEKKLVQDLVFGCKNSVLKAGIRDAYKGMPDVDSHKNPKTLPNMPFEPIFEDFEEVIDENKKDFILDFCGYVPWRDDEKEFVFDWHSKKKLPKQIAREYARYSEGGVYDNGSIKPFTKRSDDSVIHFINHCYADGILKPQRIKWIEQEDLAMAAHWISYLERRDVSYKGYIKRTTDVLNDYFFSGDSKINNRSLECFLKRDESFVERVE